ncbi:hypothetical protein, partial [Neptuniibacter sp.]|uniref:hypothetical protein n=1 Tax=Neptuniibacter sp. TaxID=1962643 RepID=UPI002637FBA6
DGATVAINFDSRTGAHLITIDTSAHSDYSTGSEYAVLVEGTTVDSGTITAWVGAFSIERAGGALAIAKLIQAATITNAAGADVAADIIAVKAETASILTDTGTTIPGTITTAQNDLDTLTGADGVTLATAQGNYAPNTTVPDAAGTAATPAEVATALADIHLDHLFAATYDPASKPGAADALLNEIIENDGGVSRFTENSLEQAPSGTGASAATIADAVWDEAQGDHVGAGTFGVVASEVADLQTQVGTAGDGLTNITWNASWDAEVQSECTDALNAYDPPTKAEMDTGHGLLATEAKQDIIDTNVDQIETAVITNAAGTDIAADIIAVKAETANILTDTAEIGAAGVGLSNITWNASWDAEVQSECTDALNAYDPPTKAEMDTGHGLLATEAKQDTIDGIVDNILIDTGTTLDTIVDAVLVDTGTTIPGLIAALNNISAADVNAQLVDVMATDTHAEIGQEAPAATQTYAKMLGYLYKQWRNKHTQTATGYILYADDTTTVDQKRTVSDDGTTATKEEIATGP